MKRMLNRISDTPVYREKGIKITIKIVSGYFGENIRGVKSL